MEPYQQLESEWTTFLGPRVPGNYMEETTDKYWQTVACATGTAALHLALEALQLPPGSKVIVPEFTMIACARAVTMAGLVPVFVDCGDDLNRDSSKLESIYFDHYRGGTEVKAIMAVHIYGRRCDMNAVHEFARRYDLYVIEDMAEIHGVAPHPDTFAACWSFYRNKIIRGEEGGIIAFKHEKSAELARELRSLGFTTKHDFLHRPRGVNARLSNAHAALILGSLRDYALNARLRRQVEGWYNELVPAEWHMPPREAVWVYDLRIPGMGGYIQNKIVAKLNEQGIPARHAFKPMSEQAEYGSWNCQHLNAYRLSREVIYLPVSPAYSREDVVRIVSALHSAVG